MAMHLTPLERDTLSELLHERISKAEIARRLGRPRRTIFAELQRNSIPRSYRGQRRYCPAVAQQKADQRRHRSRAKKMDCPVIREHVEKRVKDWWSPDQVSRRMRVDFPRDPRLRISPQTIYQWIYTHDHRRPWERCLRNFPPRKRRRSKVPQAVVIENRPAVVDRRERLGDWEGDTIVGAGKSGALVSLVERKSGFLLLIKVKNLKSATVRRAIYRRMKHLPAELRRTVTFDCGKEFAGYQRLQRSLGLAVYFADPHSPWQRGTNEHTNRLVRQYFPKGTRFYDISHAAVARAETQLNNRPRKRHGYQTPREVFFQPASETILS
jgi:transposase, IS30 family